MLVYILIILITLLFFYLKKNKMESFNQEYETVTMDQFNELFNSEIVTLTKEMMAVGVDNNKWYIYIIEPDKINDSNTLSTINYLKNEIHPHINVNKYYFIFYRNDGLREGLLYHDPLTAVIPKKNEYDNLFLRETNSKECPILHKKIYIFTYSGYKNDPTSVLIPDRFYIERDGYKKVMNEIDSNKINFNNKRSLLTWRGTLEFGYKTNFFNPENKNNLNQRMYFKYLYDNKLLKNVEYEENLLSIPEMMKYKYLLDIDGWSSTWDATVWKLYSGSVLLKVNSVFKQWYHDELKEWIHYVPVNNDFSDLNEKIQWCINNDEKCVEIINNARKFVIEKLNWESTKKYTIQIFKNYIKMYTP